VPQHLSELAGRPGAAGADHPSLVQQLVYPRRTRRPAAFCFTLLHGESPAAAEARVYQIRDGGHELPYSNSLNFGGFVGVR